MVVRKFTPEERERQREQSEKHFQEHHTGDLAGTECSWYAHNPDHPRTIKRNQEKAS